MNARLFVISAPSGAGKTSLVKALLERLPDLRVSTSHTTRPPRPTEQQGREYYFVDVPAFRQLVDEGAFLEHALVFDNHYGTSRHQLREKLAAGHDVIGGIGRPAEPSRVRELPSKVQPADEAEHLAERRAGRRP
jgi:guanylate kinase